MIITKGYGNNQMIVTQGYGIIGTIIDTDATMGINSLTPTQMLTLLTPELTPSSITPVQMLTLLTPELTPSSLTPERMALST